MSFLQDKQTIEDGDIAFVWTTRNDVRAVVITKDGSVNNKYGKFLHSDMIGKPYGIQVGSKSGRGFVHVLGATPELWSMGLLHRTQIVYSPDASYIIQRLKIRPGTRVIEAGTGSGAFTHKLALTVGETGHIYTYDYHEQRILDAQREFSDHGLGGIVTAVHRNVCQEGFEIEHGPIAAQAVFLDLPAPWTAIPLLSNVVDRSGQVRICCFSPCIEQVIKSVFALRAAGFRHIEMVENQARRFEGHQEMVRTVDEAMNLVRDIRIRRQEGMDRRHGRIDPNQPRREPFNPWGRGKRIREGEEPYRWKNVSWVESEIKSHTSYLTFAVLPPRLPVKS